MKRRKRTTRLKGLWKAVSVPEKDVEEAKESLFKAAYEASGTSCADNRDPRLMTTKITPRLVEYVVEKIAHYVSPVKIILFGSHVRGAQTDGSDLDLFVVHDSKMSNREVRRRIERLLWGRRFGVDLIVRRPEEVERNVADGNPFYTHHIVKKGRVLYERAS